MVLPTIEPQLSAMQLGTMLRREGAKGNEKGQAPLAAPKNGQDQRWLMPADDACRKTL